MISPIPPVFLQAFRDERQHAASDIDEKWSLRTKPTKASELLDFLEREAPPKLQRTIQQRFSNKTAAYIWLSRPVYGNETGREVLLDEERTLEERFEILYQSLMTSP